MLRAKVQTESAPGKVIIGHFISNLMLRKKKSKIQTAAKRRTRPTWEEGLRWRCAEWRGKLRQKKVQTALYASGMAQWGAAGSPCHAEGGAEACYGAEVWTGCRGHRVPMCCFLLQGMEINISMKPSSLVQTAATPGDL